MALEESVDGNVPFPGEVHPVGRVPPVRVEVAISKASDFRESSKDVLEDNEENYDILAA